MEELWRVKKELFAAHGNDVHRLAAETRKRQKLSGHPVVNLENSPAPPDWNVPPPPRPHPGVADSVLEEVWRIREELSAAYGHDIRRLFAGMRKREKLSGHPLVKLEKERRKP